MASAVTIAGFVLAVLPIMMTAAEYKCDYLKPVLRQKTKDTRLADFYQGLLGELTLLSACLRGLITDLSTLSSDQKKSLLELVQETWQDEAVTQALELRLGDNHQAFCTTLEGILETLDNILSNQSVKLIRHDLVAHQSSRPLYAKLQHLRKECGNTKESLVSRVRFSSKEPRLRKSLSTLAEKDRLLERLVKGAVVPDLSEIAGHATDRSATPPRKICELARSVYRSISNLSCDCAAQHEARLCINVPYDSKTSLPTKLDIYISVHDDESEAKWQESSVHLDTDIQPEVPAADHQSRVHFEVPVEHTTPHRRPRRSSATEHLGPIDVFCNLINHAYRSDAFLELLLNKQSLWHIRSSRRRTKVQETQPNTTLYDLLRGRGGAKRFSLKDRRILAVILANALLHLKDSQWLVDTWTNKDVFFMVTDNGIDFCKPYLAPKSEEPAPVQPDQNPDFLQLHRSPVLLGLGVMLLELAICTTMEDERQEEDLAGISSSINTDLYTAERVLSDHIDDMQVGYQVAVKACLDYRFVPPDASFDFGDDEFRRLVYENIVEPLETEVYAGWKIRREDIWSPANLTSGSIEHT